MSTPMSRRRHPHGVAGLLVEAALLATLVPLYRSGALRPVDLGLRPVPPARSVGYAVLGLFVYGWASVLWTHWVHPPADSRPLAAVPGRDGRGLHLQLRDERHCAADRGRTRHGSAAAGACAGARVDDQSGRGGLGEHESPPWRDLRALRAAKRPYRTGHGTSGPAGRPVKSLTRLRQTSAIRVQRSAGFREGAKRPSSHVVACWAPTSTAALRGAGLPQRLKRCCPSELL
jgi:hypothetical protein